jgi:hypothetical protein
MSQDQILLSQALTALQALKQSSRNWNALNVLVECGSETNLEDAIANLTTSLELLGVDPNLKNLNPNNLPYHTWPGQLQREVEIYALEAAMEAV